MFNPAAPLLYLLVYLIFLYVRPQEYPALKTDVPIMPVLLGLGLLTALLQARDDKTPKLWILLGGLVIAIPLSVAVNGWAGGAVLAFAKFTPAAILGYIASRSITSISGFRAIAVLLTGLGAFLAIYGIDQAANEIGWTGVPLLSNRIRYLGLLADPNDIANVLLLALPMAIYLGFGRGSAFLTRLGSWLAIGLMLWGIALTQSRGAIVALALMALAFLSLRLRNWKVLLAAPVAFFFIRLLMPERFDADDDTGAEMSSAGRIFAWHHGLQLLMGHPLFGVGYGRFLEHHQRTAHNSFVLAFAELGLVGYFFWFSIVFMAVYLMYRLLITAPTPQDSAQDQTQDQNPDPTSAQTQAAASAMLFGLIGLVTSSFFLSRTYMPVLYLAAGLSAGLFGLALKADPRLPALDLRAFIKTSAKVSIASIALIYVAVRIGTLRYAN